MNKKTLLEQAKEVVPLPKRGPVIINPEVIELTMAWVDDSITLLAVQKVMNWRSHSTAMYKLAEIMKHVLKRTVIPKELLQPKKFDARIEDIQENTNKNNKKTSRKKTIIK